MASRRRSVVAGVAGLTAGLAPYLPTVVCPGISCASCFACVGVGGAAASALVVGLVSRKLGRPRRNDETDAVEVTGGRSEA
jgi:hypothetical protein